MRGGQGGGRLRRTGVIAVAILCATVAGAVILSLERPSGVTTTLISVLVGGGSLTGVYLAWAAYSGDQRKAPDTSLEELADQLAVALGAEWEAEARVRRINDPYPLPVSWSAADAALADDWGVIEELARSGAGWPDPPPLGVWAAGSSELAGEGGALADTLARVPTSRLLVLGEPGAGKTMLMVRLVLDILKARRPGTAVPFLVPLASWNPEEQDLRGWLADQLAVGRPEMRDPAPRGGGRVGEAFLSAGLITPILDGLDEIPDVIRGPAISRINDALRPGETVVLTSRTEDYRRAVTTPAGLQIKLRATAAVQLDALTADTVSKYLIADAGGETARARWAPVLDILGTGAPVAQALTTPLMVGLARVIYNPRPSEMPGGLRDPAELCSSGLTDRQAVEAHLFDAFILAAYRGSSRWTAAQAEPCLKFLAHFLETKIRGPDLAWWQLEQVLGTPAFMRIRKTSPPPSEPSRKIRLSKSGLRRGIVVGLICGLALTGFYTWATVTNWEGTGKDIHIPIPAAVIVALIVCVGGGLVLGLVGGVVFGLAGVPEDLAHVASPGSLLARDRRATLLMMSMPAIFVGVLLGLFVGSTSSPAQGVLYGFVIGCLVASLMGLRLAWLPFVLTRGLLALRHQLPGRLMSFLADAHQRGVLRQAGPIYQFRHIEIQRRLSARWNEPPKRWWHVLPLDFSPQKIPARDQTTQAGSCDADPVESPGAETPATRAT